MGVCAFPGNRRRRAARQGDELLLEGQDQSADRFGRRFRRTHGGPCFPGGGAEGGSSNFLLMHAMGPNVAGVIGSAVAAGVLLSLFG